MKIPIYWPLVILVSVASATHDAGQIAVGESSSPTYLFEVAVEYEMPCANGLTQTLVS